MPGKSVSLAVATAEPDEKRQAYATATHSAVFVEVLVDEDLGSVKVNRVANAIYHATGKRVRDFPITLDKLL